MVFKVYIGVSLNLSLNKLEEPGIDKQNGICEVMALFHLEFLCRDFHRINAQ